jgi:hypothetical protein
MKKECPLKFDDCESCHWKFGREASGTEMCAPFSIAEDLSIISEELVKQTGLLKEIVKLLTKITPEYTG